MLEKSLRKTTKSDIHFFYRLYMEPSINPYLLYEQMDFDAFVPIFDALETGGVLYVFEQENVPVGMVKLTPFTYRCMHTIYLGGLAIDPSHAGKGLGEKLVTEAIEFAKTKGYKRVELSTSTENQRAIRLYQKLGFSQEGIYKKYTFLKAENRYLDEVIFAYWIEN